MNILKSLKLILRFRPAGSKRSKMENMEMMYQRFAGHLSASLKGHTSRFKHGPFKQGSPKMDRRLAQSKMDRTRHALALTNLTLKTMG